MTAVKKTFFSDHCNCVMVELTFSGRFLRTCITAHPGGIIMSGHVFLIYKLVNLVRFI